MTLSILLLLDLRWASEGSAEERRRARAAAKSRKALISIPRITALKLAFATPECWEEVVSFLIVLQLNVLHRSSLPPHKKAQNIL